MNTINKYYRRFLGLSLILGVTFLAGCGGNSVPGTATTTETNSTTPTILSVVPADDTKAVAINSKVAVVFSEAMSATSIEVSTFTVTENGNSTAGTISYNSDTNTASFKPNSNFAVNTVYTATLTANVKSANAVSLATYYVWTFTTGATADTTAPIVHSGDPVDSTTGVALNQGITATFSKSLDPDSVNADSFTLTTDSGATKVSGKVSYANNLVTFDPTSDLAASKLYTATLTTAIQDISGNKLSADSVWTFTTGASADTTAPTVDSKFTDPADKATGIAINRNVTAVFSEALNPETVNPLSFKLTADSGATSVAGTVSYAKKLVTFNPKANLAADTLYTATLTTAVTDLAGNALASNYIWTFTTSAVVAKGPAPVNLLTAGNFVILTKTGITNVHTSKITGDIGASPITAAAMDNVFCSEITGTIYGANAAYTGSGAVTCFKGEPADNTLVANAVLDMGTAYNDAAGRTIPDFTELHAGDISGKTLVPGLYKWGTNVLINTDVTLSGGPNDVWIFQVAQDIIQASNTKVLLTGGALPKNIFWQVGGGTGVSINTGATFQGVILAVKAINVKTGATVNGRLLAQTAVTLQTNTITQPAQ